MLTKSTEFHSYLLILKKQARTLKFFEISFKYQLFLISFFICIILINLSFFENTHKISLELYEYESENIVFVITFIIHFFGLMLFSLFFHIKNKIKEELYVLKKENIDVCLSKLNNAQKEKFITFLNNHKTPISLYTLINFSKNKIFKSDKIFNKTIESAKINK